MSIAERLQRVQARIDQQLVKNGQPANSVTLVAVSKKHPHSAILQAYECGQRDFGENYQQEALEKIAALSTKNITWHFIGPIQSNKTRAIAEHFHWAHTVDRLKIARRLSEQRPSTMPPLNICLQVNIDDEDRKAGAHPEVVNTLAHDVASLPNLSLRGLMCIPKKDQSQNGESFQKIQRIFEQLASKHISPNWDTLSMGMSGDLEVALSHGATMLRIGTDIFGPRTQ